MTVRQVKAPVPTSNRAPLPSIEDLGRHLAAVEQAYHRYDASTDNTNRIQIDTDMELLDERGEALNALMATMRPKTLADAAVLINAAWILAASLGGGEDDRKAALRARRLERILVGVLPVVAHAAGLDMEEMDWTQALKLAPHRYHGEEVVS